MKAQSDPIDGKETVAYPELLSRAHADGLKAIRTEVLLQPSDQNGRLCIVKAAVDTTKGHFEGIGDADPSNVEDFLAPHLIRVAETRAKARALRDAVNCSVVSHEELDGVRPAWPWNPGSGATAPAPIPEPARRYPPRNTGYRSQRGQGGGNDGNGGLMTEAQRRYLFRLLAGQGYQGKAAEEYLHAELEVRNLTTVTRAEASALIEQLLQSSPQGEGRGAASPQR